MKGTIMTEEIITAELCEETVPTCEVEELLPEESKTVDSSEDSEALSEEAAEESESIESLKEEILSLKSKITELESLMDTQARVFEEIGDFKDLFPEVELTDIPESGNGEGETGNDIPEIIIYVIIAVVALAVGGTVTFFITKRSLKK